jgi:RNA polymerase sigma-70 factor (ECF subfamily)
VDAWERNDVEAFTAMLAEDATFAMPPLATWYSTHDGIRDWAANWSMNGEWRWKGIVTRANGQPAIGFYAWDEEQQTHLPFALNVLTLRGSLVSDVVAFIVRSTDENPAEDFARFPDQPIDVTQLAGTFERFGLPGQLDD